MYSLLPDNSAETSLSGVPMRFFPPTLRIVSFSPESTHRNPRRANHHKRFVDMDFARTAPFSIGLRMVGAADRMLDLVVAQIGSELVVPGPADELTAAVGQDFLRERQTRDDIAVDDDP